MNNDELNWRIKALELQQQEIIANQQKTIDTLRQNAIEPMPEWFVIFKGLLTLILMIATVWMMFRTAHGLSKLSESDEISIPEYSYEDRTLELK